MPERHCQVLQKKRWKFVHYAGLYQKKRRKNEQNEAFPLEFFRGICYNRQNCEDMLQGWPTGAGSVCAVLGDAGNLRKGTKLP